MKKLIIIITLLLASCTHFEPQIATQSVYYEDAGVQLSRLMVYTRPEKPHYGPLSALFYPYHVTQQIPDGKTWGRQIGKLVWQNWTSLQLFPSMVYNEKLVYRGLDNALSTARNRGYDLLVVGFVPYLYLGHTVDDSALTIQVKIYETQYGRMLCSFEQSGRIEKRMDDDFIVVKRTHRMPESALYNITEAIAKDMAVPLTSWALFETSSDGMTAGLSAAMQAADQPRMQPYDPNSAGQVQQRTPAEDSGKFETIDKGPEKITSIKSKKQPSINLAVQFDVDKAEIRPESYPLLNELGKALISDSLKDKRIVIAGHTDSDASDEYNLDLSRRRAQSVKKYLINNFPISASRIMTTGFGEAVPLVPNTSAYNKQFNRRVQVSVAP